VAIWNSVGKLELNHKNNIFNSIYGNSYLINYSRVKNKLLPTIRTFREITFFMLCVTRIFKDNFECLRLVTLN
jgi:hypothetical protein